MVTASERTSVERSGMNPIVVMQRVEDALSTLDTTAISRIKGINFNEQAFRQRTNKMAFRLARNLLASNFAHAVAQGEIQTATVVFTGAALHELIGMHIALHAIGLTNDAIQMIGIEREPGIKADLEKCLVPDVLPVSVRLLEGNAEDENIRRQVTQTRNGGYIYFAGNMNVETVEETAEKVLDNWLQVARMGRPFMLSVTADLPSESQDQQAKGIERIMDGLLSRQSLEGRRKMRPVIVNEPNNFAFPQGLSSYNHGRNFVYSNR